MTPYLITGIVGIAVMLVGLYLRRVFPARMVISSAIAAAVGGFAAGMGIGSGCMYELGYRTAPNSDTVLYPVAPGLGPAGTSARIGDGANSSVSGGESTELALRIRADNDHPMEVGSMAPKLEAAGWLNGSAPTETALAGKVLVVDVWADW